MVGVVVSGVRTPMSQRWEEHRVVEAHSQPGISSQICIQESILMTAFSLPQRWCLVEVSPARSLGARNEAVRDASCKFCVIAGRGSWLHSYTKAGTHEEQKR